MRYLSIIAITLVLVANAVPALHGQTPTNSVKRARTSSASAAAEWVWIPGQSVPGRVFLRQPFRLTDTPTLVKLQVAARGRFSVYINGGLLVRANPSEDYQTLYLTTYVIKGPNVLSIACDPAPGPAGIKFELSIRYPSGRNALVVSNGDEKISRDSSTGWERVDFNDRSWPLSTAVAGGPAPSTQPGIVQAAPRTTAIPVHYDYSRIVRIWDIGAGGRENSNAYTRRRTEGERMLLSAGGATPENYGLLGSAGFTLLETSSDPLTTAETAPGVWDFSKVALDAFRERQAGFDVSFFPHFAFPPAWYQNRISYTPIQCLEHDQTVPAFSPWDPKLISTAERGMDQLVKRFKGAELLDGMYLGIHGDFGEAGVLSGARPANLALRDDWQKRFGNVHDHLGWWCADPLAQADFRDAMMRKYRDIELLNTAWGTHYKSKADIKYPTAPSDGTRRYWLDFVNWYTYSISAMTGDLARAERHALPDSLLMIPMGFADENPRGGNDNSQIVKIASEVRADVRSTHAGYKPFAASQAGPMGHISSAARFYGTPFWSEPPGKLTPEQEMSRLFAAVSFGSKGLFDWTDNIRQHRDLYYRNGKFLTTEKPVVDVAMFFPTTSHLLRTDSGYPPVFEKGCTDIRDVLNYDIVDERMVVDGALDRFRILVLWEGTVIEADTLARIKEWVQAGGVIVAYDFGKIETVEGDRSWFADLFGYAGRLKPSGPSLRFEPQAGLPSRYRITAAQPSATTFLAGDWYAADSPRAVSRWTGASADVRMPVDPGRKYTLLIRAAFPAETIRKHREIIVNGSKVGDLDTPEETTYSFNLPASVLGTSGVAVVTIKSETWTFADIQRGSVDKQPMGTAVSYVQLEPTGALSPAGDPGAPAGRFVTTIDSTLLKSEWAKPYGKGWTVYFPGRRQQLPAFYEVVRNLTYHLSDLDNSKRDALAIDDAWDGVYATLFGDKALYFNPGTSAVKKNITLPANRDETRQLNTAPITLNIEPNTIVPYYLTAAPQEMLYQCEGFKSTGTLRPASGAAYSPGSGATHVLIPSGGQIETRIQCDVAGRYKVFYRAVRRNALASAILLVDGKPCEPDRAPVSRGLPGTNSTSLAGSVELSKGVHSLTLKARPGEDIRADFVILTTDTNVAGYGFAVPAEPSR